MSNVPTNLIPTRVTGLPEYLGSSTLGYLPYIIDGQTYKVQFANIAAVGAVPSTRLINTGSGLGGGGDLSANRTLYILPGGVDDSRLTTTGVTAATYGAADSIPVFTVNAQGRVTGVTNTPIVLSNYVPTSRTITAGAGLTGGGDLSANRSFAVSFSSTTPEPLGPGTPGVSTVAARGDHVHPAVDLSDTTETQGVLPLSRGGTGNSLSPVVGAIAYSGGDRLYLTSTSGSAGQVLTSAGGTGSPYWQTITGTGTVTSVDLTAGTGISVSGGPITGAGSINVVNTAPDQIVALTGAGGTSISGTYPNFTITSSTATGTVTSVAASGGTTGLSFTGSPITTSGTLTLGGTLAIANGGTGATSAASALTNLGAYPASNPSGFTSNVGTVTSVSGTGTVSGLSLSGTVTSTGSLTLGGTLAVLPSNFASQTANTVLAAPNGSAGVPTFRAIVVADIPTLNQNTTGTAANVTGTVAVANGGTGATIAGTARTNLGAAASGANTDITSIGLTSGTITNAPTAGTDLVNKTYADSISAGINFHQSVNLASATTLAAYTYNNGSSGVGATITANANGALSVDGVAVASGNRILIKNEVSGNAPYNGVYTVTQTGSGAAPFILTRSTDYNTAGSGVNQINQGDFFLVTAGSTQANTSWVQQTALPITVGTTALTFTQFAAPIVYSAGTGLTLAGTVFSITNTGVGASTYGSASSVPVIAVNAQGQLTSASSSAIAIATSQVTSGTFTVGQGGTGATTLTGYVKGNGTSAFTASATIPAGDITGAALTKIDDTNVTLTLGGSPTTALLAATSITAGWTGQLAVARGGTGASTLTANGVLLGNGTSAINATAVGTTGQVLVGNTGAAPTWATLSSSAVTSFSAGTTGLTPSTATTGAITLAGTLNVANGGTGATTLSSGYLLKGNGTSAVSASVVYDNGTNVGIGTSSPGSLLELSADLGPTINLRRSGSTNGNGVIRSIGSSGTVNSAITFGGGVSNLMSFDVNGSERMRIDASGNVGIGTSSPEAKLSVYGAAGFAGTGVSIYETSTGNAARLRMSQNAGEFIYNATYSSGANAHVWQIGNTEYMRINSSGNVGIGTSSPAGKLHVSGSEVRLQGSASFYSFYDTAGTTRSGYFQNNAGSIALVGELAQPMTFWTSNTERMRIDSSGNVGIGTTGPGVRLDVRHNQAANSFFDYYNTTFGGGIVWRQIVPNIANTGLTTVDIAKLAGGAFVINNNDTNAANFTAFAVGASERMRIDSSGNVGIGTSSPTAKITVYNSGSGDAAVRIGNAQNGLTTDVGKQGVTGYGATSAGDGFLYSSGTLSIMSDNGAGVIKFSSGGNAERMRIDTSGNLLVNTTSGNGRITVRGAGTTGSTYSFEAATSGGATRFIVADNGESSFYRSDNTLGTRFFSSGDVGIGTTGLAYSVAGRTVVGIDGTNSSLIEMRSGGTQRGYIIGDTGGVKVASGTSLPLLFETNGSERMRIDSSGNVGIGTSSPAGKLHTQLATSFSWGSNWSTGTAVFGGASLSSGALGLSYDDTNGAGIGAIAPGVAWKNIAFYSNELVFNTSGTGERLRILTAGGITSASLADAVGYKGLPQNSQTASYTLALTDMGKHISITTGGVVIPANASVAFPIGSAVSIFNNSASNQTISITTDTLRQAGTTNTGSRTLAPYGVATALKVTSTVWVISGAGVS